MERYRSSHVLDEDTCREIAPLFWSRRRTWACWCAAAALGALALLAAVWQGRLYALAALLFAVRAVPTQGARRWYCHRVIHTRLYEPPCSGHKESFFTEEGLFVRDLTTGGQSTIPYRSIRQAAETEHCFLIRLRLGQWYTLVDKRCLTPEERNHFLPFLREKCPNLKVIR